MAKNSRAKRSSGRARSRRARVATTNESTQISANTGDVATQERSPSVGQHTPSNVHPANAATGVVEGVVEVRDRSVARKKAHLQPSNAEVVAVESYTPGHQLGPAGIATGSHATLVPSVTASPNQRGQAADMANQAGRANAGSTSTSSHVPSGRVLRSVSKRSALADQVGTSTQTVGGSTTGTTMDVAGTASAGRAALTPTQQRTSVGDRPEDGIRAPALLLMSEAAAMRDYGGPARGAIIPSELVSANHQPVGEENTAPAVDHRGEEHIKPAKGKKRACAAANDVVGRPSKQTSTSSHVPSGRVLRSTSKQSALASQVETSTQTVGGSTGGTTVDVAGTASASRTALTPTQQRTFVLWRHVSECELQVLVSMFEMHNFDGQARGPTSLPKELAAAIHQPVGEENTAPVADHRREEHVKPAKGKKRARGAENDVAGRPSKHARLEN